MPNEYNEDFMPRNAPKPAPLIEVNMLRFYFTFLLKPKFLKVLFFDN